MAHILDGGWGSVGDERYLISVHYLPKTWRPSFEGDEPGPDETRVRLYTRSTREAAVRFAGTMIPEDFFGCPAVELQRLEWVVREDNTVDWETLETIYVD